ncbi:MAG: hypothetical protein P1P76_11455 [Anaerolineales bacterium]|nr:hypothetical protein [Anaerolineales bacterium]
MSQNRKYIVFLAVLALLFASLSCSLTESRTEDTPETPDQPTAAATEPPM